jgi:arginine utilization regulatory protein
MGTRVTARFDFESIIGISSEIINCKALALKAAKTTSPVLVYGETGTGKELIVQAIHNASGRRDKPFIAENCASIPASLLESTLFGTVKGSFTGADDRKGLFEIADGGTLYLDELNSMPIELQSKLLRVLQEGAIRRVGSSLIKNVDVRVVASLNELPEELLIAGKLRPDLFYRLNVVRIDLPPLRNRKEDIPILVQYFIDKFNVKFNGNITGITESALQCLVNSRLEGNVRELEHIIEGLFNIKLQGNINTQDLKQYGVFRKSKILNLKERLEKAEKKYIEEALLLSKFNVTKAAEMLGIPRQTLQSKMKKFNIRRRKIDE